MIEERGHNQRPTLAEDTHPPPALALLPGRIGHGQKDGGRQVVLGFRADRQHPPGGNGDGQPQPFDPLLTAMAERRTSDPVVCCILNQR